nr:type II secretion system F family protein [Planctomycetota bacterium]
MAEFRYEATDRAGAFRTGFLTAGTLRQAIDQLGEQGLHVRRVEPVQHREQSLEVTEFLAPLSEAAAANVAGLLSDAVSADLPLEPALRAAAQEAAWSERRVLTRIADDIAAGVPTDEAFMRAGDALPSHLLALILAGLESGDLSRVLSRYLTLTRQRAEARRPLVIALAYPTILLLGMSLAFLFIMVFIVPQFEKILDDFGSQLPLMTEAVIALSRFIRSFW